MSMYQYRNMYMYQYRNMYTCINTETCICINDDLFLHVLECKTNLKKIRDHKVVFVISLKINLLFSAR